MSDLNEQTNSGIVETKTYHQSVAASRGLTIRCPHCQHPFEIIADADLTNVVCEACGEQFNLAGDLGDSDNSPSIARIAHFELIERLGMGGFGTVWKARDSALGRLVAVKIPRKGLMDADDLERFLHEARVAAQLKHPNIVNVFEIGRDGENAYIVSEMMEGKSLSVWRETHRLTHREAASLCEKICRALHHAHEEGVIHRDLKPGNILMDESGEPHITDFGLAKREAADVTMTMDGHVLGTPAYMPPEQALGANSTTDRRSDIYSLGVMLFQLLTDELPFRGNVRMLIQQAVHKEPPSPRSLNALIPADLETICLKCLEKEPSRRYQTAEELAEELKRFLRGEPILARPLGPIARVWRWCLRNPRTPGLLATLGVTLAIVYFVSWTWFRAAHARLDRDLTSRALTGNLFSANLVAETAGRDLEKRFEAVEAAARDRRLQDALATLVGDARLAPLLSQLSDPQLPEMEHALLRENLRHDARRQPLDHWTRRQKDDPELPVFAWFVLDAAGLQLARHPEENAETIGRNYAWRSYSHDGLHDQPESWRLPPGQRLSKTKLSAVFVSHYTNQWVAVISAPVMRGEQCLGTLGMMIELGKLAELPGNERRANDAVEHDRFAVLVDAREANRGQLLQHPLYARPDAARRRELLDLSQQPDYLIDELDWKTREAYRDPFAGEHDDFDRRFLAAQAPVRVHRQDTGLRVIVQESYDELIGAALGDLGRTAVYLSAVTLALAGLVVIPLVLLVPKALASP